MKSKSITDLQGQLDAFSDAAEAEAFIFVPAPASQPSTASAAHQTSTTNVAPQLYGALAPTEEYTASVQSVSSSTAGTTVAVTNGGMTFDLTFDASAPASFMTGIEQAALMLSAAISDKITVNLNIHYTGTGGGAFAGPSTGMYEDYSTIRSDLINQASPGDTTFNALVNTSSIAGQSLVAVWNSQLKALGLMSPTNAATDGSATFATDINPSLLIGVALHELTHALGRVPYGSAPDIFDLYRFTSPGVQLFTGGNTAVASYFSVDGGHTDLADYGLHSDPSDFLNPGPTFLGGPYSTLTPGDPFNELYGSGTQQSLTAVDKKLLDALGFHLTSANGISVTAASAQAVQGGAAVGLLNGSPAITDAASTTLSGATIKVSAAAGNIFPGDELFINGAQSGVVDGGRVTVSWNDSTKILTLAGVASIADYQTLLSEISYQWTGVDSSTGSHTPHTVTWTVNDGTSNLGTTSVITIERPPVATVANVVLDPNATTVSASSLLTASDPDGDAISGYAFKDTGNGHFYLNGVAQPNNQEIDVTAAQLSLLTFQSAGGVDSVQARVSDGTLWSSWQPFTITSPAPTVIEAFGSTSLVQVGSNFYLDSIATGSGPELKYGGIAAVTGQFGGWTPIGVEAVTGGYEVAWKMVGADQYTLWNTDSNGNFVSNTVGAVSGSSAALISLESSFHQDLNGDGVIGVLPTVIESFGSTSLVQVVNNCYLDSIATGTGPSLKYGGVAAVVGQFGGWTPIGAEAISGGYEVAWKMAGADQYTVWNTDSSGNFVSNTIGTVSGSSATLMSLESSFHQDLNGDGVIGVANIATTVIESFGATSLQVAANNYVMDDIASGTGPSLKYGGAVVVVGEFGGWTPIGAEAIAGGYEVAWKMAGVDQYTVWNTDGAGNFVSNTLGTVSGSSAALISLESSFHQDLNGDGVIGAGATVIESFGATSLQLVAGNYFMDSISSGTGPSLKYGGTAAVVGQFGGWTPIGAEATSGGYEVAWKMAGADQYTFWNTDSNGNFVSNTVGTVSGSSTTLMSLESSFHQDLNGDGVIGVVSHQAAINPQPNQAQQPLVTLQNDGAFVFSTNAGGAGPTAQNPPSGPDIGQAASSHDVPTGVSLPSGLPDSHDVADLAALHLLHADGFIIL